MLAARLSVFLLVDLDMFCISFNIMCCFSKPEIKHILSNFSKLLAKGRIGKLIIINAFLMR